MMSVSKMYEKKNQSLYMRIKFIAGDLIETIFFPSFFSSCHKLKSEIAQVNSPSETHSLLCKLIHYCKLLFEWQKRKVFDLHGTRNEVKRRHWIIEEFEWPGKPQSTRHSSV